MTPVVSASLGALGPLVVKLTGLLAGVYGRLRGVRREITSLRCELASMHAAVTKYAMLEDPDVQVKEWISLVRELAYDVEDCIDKFIHRLSNGKSHGGFKQFFRMTVRHLKKLGARRGIANQIDELNVRIKQVKELKDSYRLSETPCSTAGHPALDPRLRALFAEEAQLVGVDGPRDYLANWMLEDENNLSKHCKVLSIVGFSGLGKTTLANEVYRKIQSYFYHPVFISVSQKPDITKIIKDVIYNLPLEDDKFRDGIDIWDEVTSIRKLREMLKDKRYLFVIDDIWSTQAWSTIKCAFPDNNCSSRIITTTRIVDVAKSCCPGADDCVYHLEALSRDQSRRLFFTRIFGSNCCCPDMLEEVSDKILKKCGGLPLAIISISSLLANKAVVKEEWEKVKRSIGYALQKTRSLEGMSSILALSYNDLAPNLKTCLLYLSAFPEDYVIERERLVRLWIAEGFISEEHGQSRQEVAENNFYELINKSMVQPVDIGYDGKVRACRLHDMMLEILISKSAEDNFIIVVGGGQTSFANRHGFIRRLSIQHIDQELTSALANEDLSHVRSLIVTTSGCIKHLPSLAEFEALRILDFGNCAGLREYIMNGMVKLFQLKYLRLSGKGISKLPTDIIILNDLVTIDLRYTRVKELPAGVVQLTKLQHIIAAAGTKIPIGIGDMRNLRVMSGFIITQSPIDAVEDLANLTSLDELDVYFDNGRSREYKMHEEMLLSALCKLSSCKLQTFVITRFNGSLEFLDSWSPLPSSLQIVRMFSHNYFTSVPKWVVPGLTNLAYLRINLTEITVDGMHILGELPALIRLVFSLKTGPNERFIVQGTGFSSLIEFEISCSDGAYVSFATGAMPRLEKLTVPCSVYVGRTCCFYLGIEHLACLKMVMVWLDEEGATPPEIEAAGAAISDEVGAHSNRPTITFMKEL